MKAKDFTKAFESTHQGTMFANLSDIARFLGCDRSTVRPYLVGLNKFGQKYFIPDVAEAIEKVMIW